MSKQVRWRVPFVSISGTHYRVDIYDEQDGTWSGITQLLAGETPFVTDEDSSEDFFAPIRTQSGTLQVCTALSDGGRISLDELLPSNNISRPVRLINIDESEPYASAIEWMGFLSCEAYSQAYTETPENLSLPVIGVLEAMDSVPINQSVAGQLLQLNNFIYNVLTEIDNQTGMSNFSSIAYSLESMRIFFEEIDTTSMFNSKEYSHEDGTEYVIEGVSCKNVLERLCKFMGWTVREYKRTVYFQRLGDKLGMFSKSLTAFNNNPSQGQAVLKKDIINATDLEWRGVDHRRSILQGAKSVEVVAKIETGNLNLQLPPFPFGDTTTLEWLTIKYKSNTWKYIYDLFNNNNDAYNNIAYGYYSGELTRSGDSEYTFNYLGSSTKTAFFNRMSLLPQDPQPYISKNPMVAGAVFMRYAIEDEQTNRHDMQTGLYCPLLPGGHGQDAPIFKMWTPKRYAFLYGRFHIKADMLFNALYRYNSVNEQIMSDKINDSYISCDGEKLDMVLKVGDQYWTGSAWSTTRTIFQVTMTEGGMDIDIPVIEYMSGQVQIEVLAGVTVTHINTLYEVIFKSIEVSFSYNEDYQASDRSENHYFRLLSTNFRDEISVETELASDLNNQPSPSILMDTEYTTLKTLEYRYDNDPSHTESRRPEVDLLNRLALYYSAKRQRLELITKHPLVGLIPSQMSPEPLPYLTINGISPDTRKYIPLSESRDWRIDVCTLTCFETPQ